MMGEQASVTKKTEMRSAADWKIAHYEGLTHDIVEFAQE
jgi:hypothetical protein